MKIIFICGSLEPGKDGVGDYTRRLCGELLKMDIPVGMLAYNDKHIVEPTQISQPSEGYEIPCLRLPKIFKSTERNKKAKDWINLHNPEWLSLQFVPYSFQDKGIPLGIGQSLKELGGNRKWHVMIHELWIGMSLQASFKERCIGKVQKLIIKQLLSKLAPQSIHTQTALYKYQLQNLGFTASVLPLFSNIPYVKSDSDNNDVFKDLNLPKHYLVIFGSIHKEAPIEEFVKELDELDPNKTYSLVALGRNGGELKEWVSVFEKYGFDITILGEQSAEIISYVLKHAVFGLATTPYSLIEKSGSVVAMHAHKLPVICFSKPWVPLHFTRNKEVNGVFEYKTGNLKACMANDARIHTEELGISHVAETLLYTLTIK